MKVGSTHLRVLAAAWAAMWSVGSCAFPNYGFQEADGLGGRGTKPPGSSVGSGSSAASAGEGGGGGVDYPVAAESGGEAGVPLPAGGGGAGEGEGGAGAGGAGTEEPIIKLCADFESFPDDCHCMDFREHAYLYCSAPRTWAMAGFQCGFHDMRLVALDDVVEGKWLLDKVIEITQPSFQYFWIGASSDAESVVWSWPNDVVFWEGGTDGMPVGAGYAPWRGGNPDAGAGACAFAGQEGWEDGGCKDTRPYACESY